MDGRTSQVKSATTIRHRIWYQTISKSFYLFQVVITLVASVLLQTSTAPAVRSTPVTSPAPVKDKFVTCNFPSDCAVAEMLFYDSNQSAPADSQIQDKRRKRVLAQGQVKLPVTPGIMLSLRYAGVEHADSLDQLSALNIDQFSAAKLELEDAQVAHIKNFNKLRRANFDNTLITDKSLAIIAGFKNLYDLRISTTDITGSGFAALNGLPLSVFNLYGINLLAGSLSKIKTLPDHLTDINVSKTNLTGQDLAFIGTCRNLVSLDMTGNKKIGDGCVKDLLKLTKLHTLLITDTSITEKSLPLLSQMPSLKRLNVRSSIFWRKGFGKSPRSSLIIQDAADVNRLGVDMFTPLH